MSYRLTIFDTKVEMDSAEEVYALLSASQHASLATIDNQRTSGKWNEERANRFFKAVHQGLQHRLIVVLYRAVNGLEKQQLLNAMDVTDPQQIGGALSGISKNAKKLGLDSPVEIEKSRDSDGHRAYRYTLDLNFREVIARCFSARPKSEFPARTNLPEFRDYIRAQRAALAGFLEQGALLKLEGNELSVLPRNEIYVRYLADNSAIIAEFGSQFFSRPIEVKIEAPQEQ